MKNTCKLLVVVLAITIGAQSNCMLRSLSARLLACKPTVSTFNTPSFALSMASLPLASTFKTKNIFSNTLQPFSSSRFFSNFGNGNIFNGQRLATNSSKVRSFVSFRSLDPISKIRSSFVAFPVQAQKKIIRNDAGIAAAIIAGTFGLAWICKKLSQESDQVVIDKVKTALNAAQNTINSIGGQENNNNNLPVTNLSEEQLINFAQQMEIGKWAQTNYYAASDYLGSIRQVDTPLKQLRSELEKRIAQQAHDSTQKDMTDTMQALVHDITKRQSTLYNRQQFLTNYQHFFDLYRIKVIENNRYCSLLNKGHVDLCDIRAFALNSSQTQKNLTYFDFVDQLNSDIESMNNCLRNSNNAHTNTRKTVQEIINKLELIKNTTRKNTDYQQALCDSIAELNKVLISDESWYQFYLARSKDDWNYGENKRDAYRDVALDCKKRVDERRDKIAKLQKEYDGIKLAGSLIAQK